MVSNITSFVPIKTKVLQPRKRTKLFDPPTEEKPAAEAARPLPTGPEAVMPFLNVDQLEIEIGYGLTKLADPRVGGDLSERVTATRRQIALDLGFVMPTKLTGDFATHAAVLTGPGDHQAACSGNEQRGKLGN